MRLSTKGRYGVLAMYELACRYGNGPVSIKEIAVITLTKTALIIEREAL